MGAQSLSTSGTFASWSYDFTPPGDDADGQTYTVTATARDSAFKTNNSAIHTITIIRDSSAPSISTGVFTFDTDAIRLGGDTLDITWDTGAVTATGAEIVSVTLQANFGTGIITLADTTDNDGSHSITLPSVDTSTAFVQILATDAAGNVSSSVSSQAFGIDSTDPTIVSAVTMDKDANGHIDAVRITMSEAILDSTLNANDFSLSLGIGVPSSVSTSTTADDGIFELIFSNTGTTASTPTVTYTAGGLTDLAARPLASVDTGTTDSAVARVVTAEIFDDDANGVLDRIAVTFSENITSATSISGWTIEDAYDGMSIESLSVTDARIDLALAGSTYSTATDTLALTLVNDTYTDAAGNLAGNFSALALVDRAAPSIADMATQDLDGDGRIDAILVTASETLDDSDIDSADFFVTGFTLQAFSSTHGGDTADDADFFLVLTESANADTDAPPTVDYTP